MRGKRFPCLSFNCPVLFHSARLRGLTRLTQSRIGGNVAQNQQGGGDMKLRHLIVVIMMAGLLGLPYGALGGSGSGTCQIVDKPLDHLYEVGLSYVPESRFVGYGKSDVLQLDVDWAFGYIKDFGGGEMDFNLVIQDIMFLDSAGLDLPNQLGNVVVDSGFTLRNNSGTSVRIRLKPGLYTDLDEIDTDSFHLPVSFALIRAFTPDFSGEVGLDVRPGFHRLFMPILGVAWKINEDMRLDAGLPHSKFQAAITPELKTYLAFDWENTSFQLAESAEGDENRITLEDMQVYWGMQFKSSDTLQFKGELGNVFNRSVEFDRNADSKIDIQNSLFVRFAVGAPF